MHLLVCFSALPPFRICDYTGRAMRGTSCHCSGRHADMEICIGGAWRLTSCHSSVMFGDGVDNCEEISKHDAW